MCETINMSEIENIFVRSDYQEHNTATVQRARIKMGEVFQLPNERYALVCIHCSEEFQYFSEFTLHVQDHFQKVILPRDGQMPAEIAFVKTEIDDDDDENVMDVIEIIDTETEKKTRATASTSIKKNENVKKPEENKTEVKKQELKQNIKLDDDDDSCEMFDDFGNDDYYGSDVDDAAKETKKEIEPIEPAKKSKQTKEKVPKKKKRSATPRKEYVKSEKQPQMAPDDVMKTYEKLLEKFTSANESPMDPMVFEIFKAEKVDGLFPCTIKDTPEVRLMATLSMQSYKYEKIGREFLCPICTAPFPNPTSVRRHLFTHVKEPVMLCGYCPEKFRAIRYLRAHLNQKHNDESRSFECYLCHKSFQHNQFRALKDHIQTHLMETMHCMLCNKKFKEYRFYQLHMLNIHPNGIKVKDKMQPLMQPISYREPPVISAFECYVCRKIFRERRLLRSHMKLHVQQPRLCLICGIFCSSPTSLSRHLKLHNSDETKTKHLCDICGKGFKIRQYLLRHRRKDHNLWADNTPPVCQICGATFDKKSLLYDHMKIHPFEETRDFVCTICNHAARNAYNLKRHMETHSVDRSYNCPICDKSFHPRYAKDHMKSHTASRKHKCPDCGKKFKRKYALTQHMYQHGGAPQHQCDICEKSFARTDKLLRHRRRHGIPLNYHCKICLKGFISEKSYLLHESSHMKASETQVNCDIESLKVELE